MIPEKEEILQPSHSVEEHKEERQQHDEGDAPRPSVGEDDHLVSDSNNPVPDTSTVSRGAIIVKNTNDSEKTTVTTAEQSAPFDQKQPNCDCDQIDHDVLYRIQEKQSYLEPLDRSPNILTTNHHAKAMFHNSDNKLSDEVKKNTNQRPSLPVPYPNKPQEQPEALAPNRDDTVTSPTVANPNSIVRTPGSGKKVRDNTANDNNSILPGAVQIAGINQSVDESSDESSDVGDDDGQNNLHDGSMTLKIDGFVPSIKTPNYLVPEENVQRLDHLYASTLPASPANNPYTHTPAQSQNSIKQYIKKYWFALVLIMIIFVSIVIASVCLTGNCHRNNTPPKTTIIYKSFETKEELMYAVDNFTSGRNITPSLEETYGNLSEWNVSQLKDFSYLFALSRNNLNLNFDEDISRWDVSSATNMSAMFWQAANFSGDLSHWNISRVTDMSRFMSEVTYFNSNLSRWDTSRLENANNMFFWSPNFEGIGLEKWNVSKVYDMTRMFWACFSFKGNVSKWDVSNVRDITNMFGYARRFDGNLSSWDLSNVKDITGLFFEASSFRGVGLALWDTSKIETMDGMFDTAASFDANLSLWNVSNVKDMSGMFGKASSFQGIGLENWDTTKVERMYAMFYMATSFDGNLSLWNVSNVKDTSRMFHGASSFRGSGIKNWDTSNIEIMYEMFEYATSFDANLSSWEVSKVSDMSWMFHDAISFRGDGLDLWNVSQVNNTVYMFDSAISFNADLSRWDISHIENATDMFTNATSFAGVLWWDNTTDSLTSQDV